MKEARKPERWAWMGFDANVATKAADQQPNSQASKSSGSNSEIIPDQRSATNRPDQPIAPDTGFTGSRFPDRGNLILERMTTDHEYPSACAQFWLEEFERLNTEKQRLLLRWIREVCDRVAIPGLDREQAANLISDLNTARERYHRNLREQLSFFETSSEKRKQLESALRESESIWKQKLYLSWQDCLADKDITSGATSSKREPQSPFGETCVGARGRQN